MTHIFSEKKERKNCCVIINDDWCINDVAPSQKGGKGVECPTTNQSGRKIRKTGEAMGKVVKKIRIQ